MSAPKRKCSVTADETMTSGQPVRSMTACRKIGGPYRPAPQPKIASTKAARTTHAPKKAREGKGSASREACRIRTKSVAGSWVARGVASGVESARRECSAPGQRERRQRPRGGGFALQPPREEAPMKISLTVNGKAVAIDSDDAQMP